MPRHLLLNVHDISYTIYCKIACKLRDKTWTYNSFNEFHHEKSGKCLAGKYETPWLWPSQLAVRLQKGVMTGAWLEK